MSERHAFVLGTRPEIIKLAPVVRECDRRNVPYTLVHTGQHYSEELDGVFFEQLELPAPDYELDVGSKPHGEQTAEMLAGVAEVIRAEEPDVTLVQGDTNSTLAGALAASKHETVLGHVEAGLRSFDRSMPEEQNRILADHAADLLFPPTETAADQLRTEGVSADRILTTGNTVVDAITEHVELAERRSTVHEDFGVTAGEYGLVTVHRAENVDDADVLAGILEGVDRATRELDLDVLYPIHPRARNAIDAGNIDVPAGITLTDPLDYLDFLMLERYADLVFTDSGGVQEETCVLGTPCVTVRENTERPETISVGANRLVGTSPSGIRRGAIEMVDLDGEWENPFGDGTAGRRILDATMKRGAEVEVVQ